MTIPFFVEEPITHKKVEVPQDVIHYCDHITIDADYADLRYLDCVWMHMGYYGNDPDVLKKFRDEFYRNPRPVFE